MPQSNPGKRAVLAATAALLSLSSATHAAAADPLPSWNDSAAKRAVVAFVGRVTDEASADYVAPAERIAVFDNDGCLWAEQPLYFQLVFALDRVRAMAADHPEWRDAEPLKSVLSGDDAAVLAAGKEAVVKVLAASHTGMTTDEFRQAASDWLAEARHPSLGRRYVDCVYQPQLEMLAYLRANGFKTFIVSGGGLDFLRVFAEDAYGVPPEQVVGTSIDATYELRDGQPVLVKQPKGLFVDDKAGKPAGIHRHIGRRPILAFGNSDGDFEMLEYTTAGPGARLGVLIHHTDAEREFAYDRDSHVGRLDRGLDEAAERGWVVVDMQSDWRRVFPAQAD